VRQHRRERPKVAAVARRVERRQAAGFANGREHFGQVADEVREQRVVTKQHRAAAAEQFDASQKRRAVEQLRRADAVHE
jgi:hypothetical protein